MGGKYTMLASQTYKDRKDALPTDTLERASAQCSQTSTLQDNSDLPCRFSLDLRGAVVPCLLKDLVKAEQSYRQRVVALFRLM